MGLYPKWWSYNQVDREGYGGFTPGSEMSACTVCGKRMTMYYPYDADPAKPRGSDAVSYPGLKTGSWSDMLSSNEYLKIFSDRNIKPGSKKGKDLAQKIVDTCTACRKVKNKNYEEAERTYRSRKAAAAKPKGFTPVSYTHLTLPTTPSE